jgi:thymidylate kinase
LDDVNGSRWSLRANDTGEHSLDQEPRPGLVSELARALEQEDILCCHLVGSQVLLSRGRPSHGEVLDFLLARSHAARFAKVLLSLGFRPVSIPPAKHVPGFTEYVGLDPVTEKVVTVRAGDKLLAGRGTKIYQLAIDDSFFSEASRGPLFKTCSVELEYALLVIAMTLKHTSASAILSAQERSVPEERRRLDQLARATSETQLRMTLSRYFPFMDEAVWQSCVRSLQPGCANRLRMAAARELHARLAPYKRQVAGVRELRELMRGWSVGHHRAGGYPTRMPHSGGALIAFVGGDGSGKSSVVEGLHASLSRIFPTKKTHLGNPPRSAVTLVVKGLFFLGRRAGLMNVSRAPAHVMGAEGIGSYPGNAWVIWHLLKARDRYRAYLKARRFAARGGLVVCDRFPIPEIKLMDYSRTTPLASDVPLGWLARRLIHWERSYYEHIACPDVLVVLKVHPDVAVERKAGEDPSFVRARSREVWEIDWTGTGARVIDTGRPQSEVLTQVKREVWSSL